MSEREPGHQRWDIEAISQALRSEAVPEVHPQLGPGYKLTLGAAERDRRLALYPDRFLLRYRSPSVRLDLHGVSGLVATEEGIAISAATEEERWQAGLTPDGGLTFAPEALPAPEQLIAEKGSERQRVTIVGRAGQPRFRTTPKGTLILRLPVAVHDGSEKPVWRVVKVFGARAEKLQGTLNKGAGIHAVGYLHQQERTKRDGSVTKTEEIYATVVKLAKAEGS